MKTCSEKLKQEYNKVIPTRLLIDVIKTLHQKIKGLYMGNNILTNLPMYMAIIGFLGIVVMFAKPYVVGQQ